MITDDECDAIPPIEEGEAFPDLRTSDIQVLQALSGDDALAFQGLKRKMHIHQEKLSRALQRLEDDGLVVKSGRGYALTSKGSELAQRWLAPAFRIPTVIVQSFVPIRADPRLMASNLVGRWFGNLRWLGMRETPESVVLRWVTYDGRLEVTLRMAWEKLTIETNAKDDREMVEAFQAAQHIFGMLAGPWNDDWHASQLAIST